MATKYRGKYPRNIKEIYSARVRGAHGVIVKLNDGSKHELTAADTNGIPPGLDENFDDFMAMVTAPDFVSPSVRAAHGDLKTNPAKRPAPKKRAISRPSQVTKKAPSKRLVARRKLAAKKPVKGYFPNPAKKPAPHSALPYCVQLEYEGRGWKTVAAFAAQIPAENHAHGIAKKFPDGPSIRVIKK